MTPNPKCHTDFLDYIPKNHTDILDYKDFLVLLQHQTIVIWS